MLSRLIKFSLDHASLVLLMATVMLVTVVARIKSTPVDVFPELNAPTVVIMTEAPGLAADEVEQYVTFPIETSVNGMPGIRRVRTTSAIGLSVAVGIKLGFHPEAMANPLGSVLKGRHNLGLSVFED